MKMPKIIMKDSTKALLIVIATVLCMFLYEKNDHLIITNGLAVPIEIMVLRNGSMPDLGPITIEPGVPYDAYVGSFSRIKVRREKTNLGSKNNGPYLSPEGNWWPGPSLYTSFSAEVGSRPYMSMFIVFTLQNRTPWPFWRYFSAFWQ